ncbi:phenylalanine 4-monooxygenase [Amylibacter marinus]|uniref:phenylalanine 4-monooxygenase n=1 Tax=Amylibacter marinus TaxID=1475483 RepID=A0ABQ5VZ46_9RHOB|nr:phenylalanine 4-monooxygenase [Amylibacter marinus]GLQ36356.1 phenylalanine 4-monooxygenase [Amylibacter marinus]
MGKISSYSAKIADAQGHILYTAEEDAVWADLYAAQAPNIQRFMSDDYLQGLDLLDMPKYRVPSCVDISERLLDLTGWRVEPVPALIGFKQFFEMLSKQVFPAASFIRSRKDFDYIEEPDIFHEIFGHTPLLTNPNFAAFSQAIGRAGLSAERGDYAWLIRLYWFTIEFGLVLQNDELKALGSGLASSPTELVYAVQSDVPDREPFDIQTILRTPYRIDMHQMGYFVIDNPEVLLDAAKRDLMADVRTAQNLGLLPNKFPAK